MPIFNGSTPISELYVGSVEVGEGWVWDGSQWVQVYSGAPEFVQMGMDKSGQLALVRNVRTMITGWSVRAGYPDTVIDGNRIRVAGSTDVRVTARIDFPNAHSTVTQHRWIMHNGVEVAADSYAGFEPSVTLTADIAVSNGDYVWTEAMVDVANAVYRTIEPTTYVSVDLAP